MDAHYSIEHHFTHRDLLPAKEQVFQGVRIVSLEEEGEVLFEYEGEKVVLGFGGLCIKIHRDDFSKALRGLKND